MTVSSRLLVLVVLVSMLPGGASRAQTGSSQLDSMVSEFTSGTLSCMEAVEAFRTYRTKHPKDAYANLYLGRAYDWMANFHGVCGYHSDSILAFADSAIAYFRIAQKISPSIREAAFNFSLSSVIGHTHATKAMWYLYKRDLERARAELRLAKAQGGFPPALLEWTREALHQAAPNSIIAGRGDDDCFPYWYLQLVENLRPDVTHVSLPLLAVPWYEEMLTTGMHGATAPIDFTPPPHSSAFETVESALDAIQSAFENDRAIDTFFISKEGRERISRQLGRSVPAVMITRAFRPNENASSDLGVSSFMEWHEILRTNAWKRPIYLATPVDVFRGNDSLMRLGPLLTEILPVTNKLSPSEWVDVAQFRVVLGNTSLLKLQAADPDRSPQLDLLLSLAFDRANEELMADSSQHKVDEMLRELKPLVTMWPDALVDGYAGLIVGFAQLSGISVTRELASNAAQLKVRIAKAPKQFSKLHYLYAVTLQAQHDCKSLSSFWKSLAWIDRDELDEETTGYYDGIKSAVDECE